MAEIFFGVSMIPMNYKDEVRQIKSELLSFLRHPNVPVSAALLGVHLFRSSVSTSLSYP